MRNYQVKEIHALSRGLKVLKVMHSMRSASLHELHRETGIPKSTLTRILLTLHKQGFVWQRMVDGAFLTSYLEFHRLSEPNDREWLVELASPFLEALSEKVQWPSVLSSLRLDYMEVVEANSPKSYYDDIPLGPVGFRANMLRSSSGRAYLSFCSAQERETILQRLREKDVPGNRLARDTKAINKLVRETRKNGYAVRAPDFGGDYDKPREEVDDGRESIAIPIMVGSTIFGCMNITWRSHVLTLAEARRNLLPALQDTVSKLSAKIEKEMLTRQ